MKIVTKIRELVVDALFLALLILFTFVPYLGYIQIVPGVLTITTMHLLVLIGASLFGWKKGLLYGFFFGISSLIKAATIGAANPVDFIYVNPLISVLPRVLFGLFAGSMFDFAKKRLSFKQFGFVLPFIAICATLIHSILTLGSLYIFGILDIFKISEALGLSEFCKQIQQTGFLVTLGLVTLFGILGEMAASALIVTPSFFALRTIPFIKAEDSKYKVVINSSK